jgi:hypothetical protein
MGEYPTKIYRALSGKTVRRSFGNRPFGFSLELDYENVPEATVQAIINHYNTQQGQTLGFTVSSEVFAGLSAATIALVQAPAQTLWFYAEAPSIEAVHRNISSVGIKLIADLV